MDIVAIHRFTAPIVMNDNIHRAHLLIREMKDGKRFYDLTTIEMTTPASQPGTAGKSQLGYQKPAGVDTVSINDLLPPVKELFQPDSTPDKRGSFRITPCRKVEIRLFEKANLSTFLHETGHFFLEVMGDLTQADNAPQAVRDDYQALLKWLEVESRDQLGRDQHEQFARGFEAYLMEGKAPSSVLRQAFAAFKVWLTAIYRRLTGLDVELTPEVRQVMDRMLATDLEIQAVESEAGIAALFNDAAAAQAAGMTEAQYERYRKAVDAARQSAEDEVRSKVMQAITREREAWWNDELAKVKAEVAAELSQQPVYIALANRQNGKQPDGSDLPEGTPAIKLDRDDLVQRHGQKILKLLPMAATSTQRRAVGVWTRRRICSGSSRAMNWSKPCWPPRPCPRPSTPASMRSCSNVMVIRRSMEPTRIRQWTRYMARSAAK